MRLITFISCFLFVFLANAQENEKPKSNSILISSFSAYYAYEIPGADLANRFGDNHKVGGTFSVKTAQNFLFELDGGYFWGNKLKQEALSIFDDLKNDEGTITSRFGTPGSILLNERGFSIFAKFGKIFPVLQANDNSGPFVSLGVGFLQHKIRIDNESNDTPQVLDDYKKGYDHLTNGVALNQFIGYRYYANNKMLNFYIGVEFTEAFTQNRRGYNYNTMSYDNKKRLDVLTSFKAGFVIPISKRNTSTYYIY